nr:hypothetical protein [Cereibacter sphaeroides]
MTESSAASRVIVLLSDGQDNAHQIDARQVAGLAARHGVRIPHDRARSGRSRDPSGRPRCGGHGHAPRHCRGRAGDGATACGGWRICAPWRPTSTGWSRTLRKRPPVLVPEPLWPWPALLALGAALVLGLRRAGLAPWPRRAGRAA